MDMTSNVAAEVEPVPQLQEDKTADYPVSIFGKLPHGFVLEEQQIQMLMYWYRKAIAAGERLPVNVSDDDLAAACDIINRLYTAILKAKAQNACAVALKLEAVLIKLDSEKNNSIEDALDVDDIRRLATELVDATKLSGPVKKLAAPRRGRKLTRAGLLYRYQSFLMKEIQTLSWNLYGNRDYALQYIEEDDAVNQRCRDTRHKYPFFDESKLADRAKSVLKSLKIDTKQFDVLGRHATTWVTSEAWPGR